MKRSHSVQTTCGVIRSKYQLDTEPDLVALWTLVVGGITRGEGSTTSGTDAGGFSSLFKKGEEREEVVVASS